MENNLTPPLNNQPINNEIIHLIKYNKLVNNEPTKPKTSYKKAHELTQNIYNQIKSDSEKRLTKKLKKLEMRAFSGNLKPIWGELKRKTKGNACYISELYTDDNNNKTSPNYIIAILTKHIRKTFYREYHNNNHLCPSYLNDYLCNNNRDMQTNSNDANHTCLHNLNNNRSNSKLFKYLTNSTMRNNL